MNLAYTKVRYEWIALQQSQDMPIRMMPKSGDMLTYFDKVLTFFFPEFILTKRSWIGLYREQEREAFVRGARVFYGIIPVVYVLHYFTVDRSEGLAPSHLWFTYRFSMAAIGLACLALCFWKRFSATTFHRWPTFISCAIFTYFQARTVVWYPAVPYIYSFLFVLISIFILRSSIVASLIYSWMVMTLIVPSLHEARVSPSMIFSACVVTSIFVIFIQMRHAAGIRLFAANQQILEAQAKIIEVNIEFNNHLRAFLPREIYRRILLGVRRNRMTATQAIDEVLRPRKKFVGCVFSDIRGYTRSSKNDDYFIMSSVLPNLKESTEVIEGLFGIPRKIGDLIFAYFDDSDGVLNVCRAVISGYDICRISDELNSRTQTQVIRNVIVTAGEATVGNVGGPSSSFEITALGNPANLAARIDEISKHASLRSLIDSSKIICDSHVKRSLSSVCSIDWQIIDLQVLGLRVRDFDEETQIFLLKPTKSNLENLLAAMKTLSPSNTSFKDAEAA